MLKTYISRILKKGKSVTTESEDTPESEHKTQDKKKTTAGRKNGHWSRDDFHVGTEEGKVRFHDFDLPDPVMRAIQEEGFEYCTEIQSKVFEHIGSKKNIAGRAQTGTGKTAAFLISIFSDFWNNRYGLNRPAPGKPRALVLAPTRELCRQIVKDADKLAKYTRFRSVAVYGGKDFDKQRAELQKQPVELVAATPGRLLDCINRRLLNLKELDVVVIDEADRMLDMGFIPDVRRIIRATPPVEKRQTMLFSATLTDQVLKLASQWAPDPVFCEVAPEQVAVDTVKQIVYVLEAREKFTVLCNLLEKYRDEKVLIFRNRRDSTKRLVKKLMGKGIRAEHLSGEVHQDRRIKALERFQKGTARIVVATDVAGRGLHVDDIALVVNYDFPYEAEDYVHRIGRTGRATKTGAAISFACEKESFVIPEIEEYIGEELQCAQPGPELLR